MTKFVFSFIHLIPLRICTLEYSINLVSKGFGGGLLQRIFLRYFKMVIGNMSICTDRLVLWKSWKNTLYEEGGLPYNKYWRTQGWYQTFRKVLTLLDFKPSLESVAKFYHMSKLDFYNFIQCEVYRVC